MSAFFDLGGLPPVDAFLLNSLWISSLLAGSAIALCALLPRRRLALRQTVLACGVCTLLLAPLAAELARRGMGSSWSRAPATAVAPPPAGVPSDGSAPAGRPTVGEGGSAKAEAEPPVPATPVAPRLASPLAAVLASVWLGGALLVLLCVLVRLRRVGRLVGRLDAVPPVLEARWHEVCAAIGLRRVPPIATAAGIDAPMALGLRRAVVVYPRQDGGLDPAAQRAVLAHEAAHARYGHHRFAFVQALLRVVLWWQPLALLLNGMLEDQQEELCDARAVAVLDVPRRLAEAIVHFAERAVLPERPVLGATHARRLESRLATILAPPPRWQLEVSATALAVVFLGSLAVACGATRVALRQEGNAPDAQDHPGQTLQVHRSGDPGTPAEPVVVQGHNGAPPSITYGSPRQSRRWIGSYAVDTGLTFAGVTAYLSLTDDIIVVDAASGSVRWTRSGSAFYDQLTFRRRGADTESPIWMLRLRNFRLDNPDLDAYYDLATGEPLRLTEQAELPPGRPIELPVFSGDRAVFDQPIHELVTSAEQWRALRRKLFGDPPPPAAPDPSGVDFARQVLYVVSSGRTSNCNGIRYDSAFDAEDRLLLRLKYLTYQTVALLTNESDDLVEAAGGDEWPWGIFVLPRPSRAKRLVVERDHQRYIGGPPIWKPFAELDLPPR